MEKIIRNSTNENAFGFFGGIGDFKYTFLYCTHLYITLYFGLDVLISLKIMYLHYIGIFLLALIRIAYAEPRPFWEEELIESKYCYNSYGHPSDMIFTFLFLGSYLYLLYKRKMEEIVIDVDDNDEEVDSGSISQEQKKSLIAKIMEGIFVLVIVVISFFRLFFIKTSLINIT